MKTTNADSSLSFQRILLAGILFLTFFQLLTEFVEAIYLFGLLGTEIPPEIVLVLLFFSPIILLMFKSKISSSMALNILISIVLLSRAIEIILPTRERLIITGVGFAAVLLFFPAKLAVRQKQGQIENFIRESTLGLSSAIFALVLTRALNSGSDITASGMFRIVAWIIVLLGLFLTWRRSYPKSSPAPFQAGHNRFQIFAQTLGIYSIVTLMYFSISAPNIITRWGGYSNLIIHILLLGSWLFTTYWWLTKKSIPSRLIISLGALFVVCMFLSIYPHQINFPQTAEIGYPLPEPKIPSWQTIPVYLMVLLSPALLLAFNNYLDGITTSHPSSTLLSGTFSFGSGFLLIMVLSQVFTTVYDYIPFIGPAFRDKYWLVFLIPAILSFLPMLVTGKPQEVGIPITNKFRKTWFWLAVSMAIIAVVGLMLISARPISPLEEKNTLRVLTYNIQQGYNDQGERNFDGQLKLINSLSPDIIGLQECDTARIAGGNADVVAYFADRLNMYSYYGPSSVAGTFGIALLSRYPIQNAATFYLFSSGEQVAVIEAEIIVNDKIFKVYVTHLGNGGPIVQMHQMLELMQDEINVIAMGDFNFRPYEDQYAITTALFEDAYIIAQKKTIPSLWGKTEPFDINERIDHIFISDTLVVPYLEYLTQPESDHPGLFAEISW